MSLTVVILSLEQLSCLLSIFGSICVTLTWAYPVENRFKHGRILLLWLSFADGISSLVYFLQTIGISDTEDFCTVMALLGIFFPVASFLWTDFIAFYLYLTVVRRTRNPISWTTLLRVFHVIAWSVSLVIIIVVAVFDHAGRSNEGGDDDLVYSNTGGWCWIKGNDADDVFLWELIGGKIVEWVSCLVILPYLYGSVCCKLRGLDARKSPLLATTSSSRESRASSGAGRRNSGKPVPHPNKSSFDVAKANAIAMNTRADSTVDRRPLPAHSESQRDDDDDESEDGSRSRYACEDSESGTASQNYTAGSLSAGGKLSEYQDMEYNSSATNNPQHTVSTDTPPQAQPYAVSPVQISMSTYNTGDTVGTAGTDKGASAASGYRSRGNSSSHSAGTSASSENRNFFSKFYYKLAALPLVFLFIRFWGSMRIVLIYAQYDNKPVMEFFAVMQAFFDPSQGFFNALLFVFSSPEDRLSFYLSLAMVANNMTGCMPCCGSISGYFASVAAVNKQRILASRSGVNNSTITNPLILQTDARPSDGSESHLPDQLSMSARSQSVGNISLSSGILSDFECDDANRLSDFSFDSRMDSDYV